MTINNIFLEVLDENVIKMEDGYYKISDESLTRIIMKIIDFQYRNRRLKMLADSYKDKYNRYKMKAHIYKVELGRCRRKLTNIYKMFKSYIRR